MMWDLQILFHRHAREIERFLRRRGHNSEAAARHSAFTKGAASCSTIARSSRRWLMSG